VHSSNYQHDRKRCSIGEVKSTNGNGRGQDFGRISPGSTERKRQSWHDRHIKKKSFKEGDLVLLYDNKFFQHPGKFRMHWLGPYEVNTITDGGYVQLKDLGGT
jgi:hypothetical protein